MSTAASSKLAALMQALDAEMPFSGAAAWDNVGMLIEPSGAQSTTIPPGSSFGVVFTNDITDAVLRSAATAFSGQPARAIVSYHPTPFSALKKFSHTVPAARAVLSCAAMGAALISPHTAWDAAPNGLNDWLLNGIVSGLPGELSSVVKPVKRAAGESGERGAGDGRVGLLSGGPVSLADVVAAVKTHLAIETVQVALPSASVAATVAGAAAVAEHLRTVPVNSIAVCAGSGGGVLGGFSGADVWVTGEMSHHEVLAAAAAGVSVILTQHSRCERGFLPVVIERLRARLGPDDVSGFSFALAPLDADPLRTL